jgi:hypothetical protein
MVARTWFPLGRNKIEDDLIGMPGRHSGDRGPESPNRNTGLGPGPTQPETVTANLATVVIAALARE